MVKIEVSIKFYINVSEIYNFIVSFVTSKVAIFAVFSHPFTKYVDHLVVKIEVSIKFYIDVLEIYNFIVSSVTFHLFHWMTNKQIGVSIVTESPLVG